MTRKTSPFLCKTNSDRRLLFVKKILAAFPIKLIWEGNFCSLDLVYMGRPCYESTHSACQYDLLMKNGKF